MSDQSERKARMAARQAEREALRREIAGLPPVEDAEPSVSNGEEETGRSLMDRLVNRSSDVDRAVEDTVRGERKNQN